MLKDNGDIQTMELFRDEGARESRVVTLVRGPEYAVIERSQGEQTEFCYGRPVHGHKMLFSEDAYAQAFDNKHGALEEELKSFFREGAFLSDLQDLFETREIPYGYVSWMGGSVVFRPQRNTLRRSSLAVCETLPSCSSKAHVDRQSGSILRLC